MDGKTAPGILAQQYKQRLGFAAKTSLFVLCSVYGWQKPLMANRTGAFVSQPKTATDWPKAAPKPAQTETKRNENNENRHKPRLTGGTLSYLTFNINGTKAAQ